MKTQIVQLEPHDDVVSTRDKMGWGKTGRILLIWPDEGRILTRRLDLVLLQRHSASLGAQLALVSRDRDVRYHARHLNIPVFSKMSKAQSMHWRTARRKRWPNLEDAAQWAASLPRPGRFGQPGQLERPIMMGKPLPALVRLAIFTVGVLAFLSIAAVLFPGASLRLSPEIRSQGLTLRVTANPELKTFQLNGQVPAQTVSVVVEGREEIPASGSMRVPDQPASGQVIFTNLTDQPVKVAIGSVVRASGLRQGTAAVRFATTRAGQIPAGPGQTINLPVRAIDAGASGNLQAGQLNGIEGPLGTQVTVTNPEPTSGGSDRAAVVPSQADRRKVYETLLNSLNASAQQEILKGLPEGSRLLEPAPRLISILEEEYQPEQAAPSDALGLNLRLEFSAQVVSGDDLKALAAAVLDANLPAGYQPLPQTLTITSQEPQTGSSAAWEIHIHRDAQAQLVDHKAVQLALGLAPAQAVRRLADNLPLRSTPEIVLTPAWWPRLPVVPFRITVQEVGAP